ncbi:PP2C family protein-serine/threonine phosphatase [Streptomyces sp. NBC_00076]|uniref:PP2C family protein-serine/threonine phosphatase n=1 Tax=Streptomyces sp. NBC_00076 TaxID=2975642 RepID=UPI003246C336
MIATTPALLVSPDGEVEELLLDSRHADQMTCIRLYVQDPSAHPLGRKAVVHVGRSDQSVNDVAGQAWMSITGGSRPPVLRGPVVITGAVSPAGDFMPLPDLSAQAVRRAGELLADAIRLPSVSAVQRHGGRRYQCDAYAITRDKVSGRWAFVVLDGVGDRPAVQHFAEAFAPRLARAAAVHGDPARALAAVRVQARGGLGWDFDPRTDPSAVAVVATVDHRSPHIRLAWTGDARAYRGTLVGTAEPATQDHNYAQKLRSRGRAPGRYDRNFITSCLMTGSIGTAAIPRRHTRRLLLCSDGVYAPLEEHGPDIGGILDFADDAKDAATILVDDAIAASKDDRPDNATALVVDIPQY